MAKTTELVYEERPYHMNEPGVVAITGQSGYIHRTYTLRRGKVSAVYSPPGGIGFFTDGQGRQIAFWEIYCWEGDLFDDVERFATEEEMLKRLAHYNRQWWEFWK
jgi:hypothetical protein